MVEREKLITMVRGLQNGDPEAATQLYETFQSDIYYFILKTVNNDRELAEDLTQDTFIEILETIDKLQEPAAFVTWSKQIAYHKCTAYFRKRKELLVDENEDGYSVFDTVEEDREEFIPDAALDHEDLKQTIIQMINDLPEEQKSAILLRYFNEISVKEIADIQGVTEGTVKSRLNYGRKAIKQSVEEYEKKNGIKLHCAGVLPLLLWLFKMYRVEMGLSITSTTAAQTFFAGEVAIKTAAAVGVSASTSASAAAATTATSTATTTAATTVASSATTVTATSATATAKTAVAAGGKALATKIVAGVAAAAITVGGVAVGIASNKECDHVWAEYKAIELQGITWGERETAYEANVCRNCGAVEVLYQSQLHDECEEHEWNTREESYENFILVYERCWNCLKTEIHSYENTCKHSFVEYQVAADDGTTLTRSKCTECGCLKMEGETCLHIHKGPEFREDNKCYDITCADCGSILQSNLPSCLMGGEHIWGSLLTGVTQTSTGCTIPSKKVCIICDVDVDLAPDWEPNCKELHRPSVIKHDENNTFCDVLCEVCGTVLQGNRLSCSSGGKHIWNLFIGAKGGCYICDSRAYFRGDFDELEEEARQIIRGTGGYIEERYITPSMETPSMTNTEPVYNVIMGTVTAEILNVHIEPNADSIIIDQLSAGSRIEIAAQRDGWGRTKRGWVNMGHIQLDDAQTAVG